MADDFVTYAVTFVILGVIPIIVGLAPGDLTARVRRIGTLRWTGGAALCMAGPVLAGVLLSESYLGLFVGLIFIGLWVCAPLFYRRASTESERE